MCTYNGEQYLIEQLESLINQTYENLEIIIFDDRSSDGTMDILKAFASRDTRLSVIQNEKNLGYVKNFEKAIYQCKGKYIALCDQDDVWELNKIERLVNAINDSLLIYHDSQLIDVKGNPLKKVSDLMNMYRGNSPLPFLFYNCISGHSCLFNNQLIPILKATGGFNPKLFHDWWIAFLAAYHGVIAYIDEPLVKYRQHSNSNTDILNVKEKKKNGVKYPDIALQQLEQCATIQGQYQSLIKRILFLYQQTNWYSSFQLMNLLFKHTDDIFYLKKKSFTSKLNYIRKLAFQKR
jgi:glycosyltransferase involved in cell wall biosynthesis